MRYAKQRFDSAQNTLITLLP